MVYIYMSFSIALSTSATSATGFSRSTHTPFGRLFVLVQFDSWLLCWFGAIRVCVWFSNAIYIQNNLIFGCNVSPILTNMCSAAKILSYTHVPHRIGAQREMNTNKNSAPPRKKKPKKKDLKSPFGGARHARAILKRNSHFLALAIA